MNQDLINFIELLLSDGKITKEEEEVIYRKAKELNVPNDECKIILESMIHKHLATKSNTALVKKEKIQEKEILTKPSKVPLKKVKKVKKLNFDKKEDLIKLINDNEELIKKSNDVIETTLKLNKQLLNTISENKNKLITDLLISFKSAKKKDKIILDKFNFEVDELIPSSKIKSYFKRHGSIQYGKENDKFSPEYPHPLSYFYKYIKLGEDVKDENQYHFPENHLLDTTYLSGYIDMESDSFKYFKSRPIKIFDLKKENPELVLIYNKSKKSKFVILVFETYFKLLKLSFSFSLKRIYYGKNYIGKYTYSSDNYYHTYIEVNHNEIDLFKDIRYGKSVEENGDGS